MMLAYPLKRVGTLVNILSGYAFNSANFSKVEGMPLVRIRDLGKGQTETNYVGKYRREFVVEPGDLLIGMDGDFIVDRWNGGTALLNQRVCKCTTLDNGVLSQNYLFYSIIDRIDKIQQLVSATTVKHLSIKQIQQIEIPLPGIAHQTAIAEVLATVDRAIAQTEALIAKQRRIKAGLMHDLLTRGIDEEGNLRHPSTHEFKESAVGLVPAEWEVEPLQNSAEIASGVTLGRTLVGSDTVELPYLRVANVQDGYVDLSEVKKIQVYRHEVSRFLLQSGDVLMNEGGDYDKLGRGTVWRGQIDPCLHQNHVFRVRVNQNRLLPEFLAFVSASPYGKRFFVLSSKQSTNLASINSTQLKAFPIPRPSIAEQRAIVDVVNTHEAVVDNESMQLAKLQRLKTGLMQDLLTGRLSVEPLLAQKEEEVQ